MITGPTIHFRLASIDDKDFVLSLLPRLMEFGPPAWRDRVQMISVDIHVLSEALTNPPAGTVIFIAENDQGLPLGFIHLETDAEYYNRELHGHIANVIVAPEGEGRGIGRALIEKGEEWARSQGFRWLTLNVFAQNLRAREVYEKLGYGADILKYVKELG
jgi:ribosomal protein S18 acetylase RimI-like enzyme